VIAEVFEESSRSDPDKARDWAAMLTRVASRDSGHERVSQDPPCDAGIRIARVAQCIHIPVIATWAAGDYRQRL